MRHGRAAKVLPDTMPVQVPDGGLTQLPQENKQGENTLTPLVPLVVASSNVSEGGVNLGFESCVVSGPMVTLTHKL